MKGRRGHHFISLLSCVCGLAIASSAAAQQVEQGAQEPTSAEIIVTATRRAETLQETPLAVDVVTGQEVAKLNLFDVKEIQNVVPGLTLENGDGRSNIATLRGISFNPDSGSSDAVQVYFNEIDVDPNTFFSAIYDIGQIQVLREQNRSLADIIKGIYANADLVEKKAVFENANLIRKFNDLQTLVVTQLQSSQSGK